MLIRRIGRARIDLTTMLSFELIGMFSIHLLTVSEI